MTDPSKRDKPKRKSLASDALEKAEEKARQNLHENLDRLGTVEPKPKVASAFRKLAEEVEDEQRDVSAALGNALRTRPQQPTAPKDTIDWDHVLPPIPEKRKTLINKPSVLGWLSAHPKVRVGGGLAIAGFGLGTQLSGASKLAALFYLISWAVWCLVIYFSLWKKTHAGSIALMAILAVGIVWFWWMLLPSPPERQLTAQEIADEVWKRSPATKASDGSVRWISKPAISERPDLPFALRVTIQSTVTITPVHLIVECDGPIGRGLVGYADGDLAEVIVTHRMLGPNRWELFLDRPSLTPQRPLQLVLYSATQFRVLRVDG